MGTIVKPTNVYFKGQMVRFSVDAATPFAIGGLATDPTTVICRIRQPNGTKTPYTYGVDGALKRSGVGVYYIDVSLDTDGEWGYRFEGSGNLQAVAENTVFVEGQF